VNRAVSESVVVITGASSGIARAAAQECAQAAGRSPWLFEPMREWNRVEGGWRRTRVRVMVETGAAATAAIGTALTARRWSHH
jgi:hypothetical protein